MTTFYVLGKVDIFLNEGGQKFLEALLGWTLSLALLAGWLLSRHAQTVFFHHARCP